MPLTFAHPAAVLPFPRRSRWFDFSALVLGSMAPDFEYFFRGEPYGVIGHTLAGFFYFNLPLVILFYPIYHQLIHDTLHRHLPSFLQEAPIDYSFFSKLQKSFVIIYSALLGMLTHVVWDSFTHVTGYMVERIPALTHSVHLIGLDIPIFKILQHGSTLFGLSMIFLYIMYRAIFLYPQTNTTTSRKQKLYYWLAIIGTSGLIMALWYTIFYEPVFNYGTTVVRLFDSMILSLLIVSILFKNRGDEEC
ncbi:DUF4184 family protein [Bacillus sp. FJAT-42315]|uniref:DUF4184 family protein n=1 Tax=Bacillus sp. FJAT-42315 TaxID=2014077 RepID=UPI000C239BA9|nr:DUF4184 family protein [Bacillus sp. FJAT-42315]